MLSTVWRVYLPSGATQAAMETLVNLLPAPPDHIWQEGSHDKKDRQYQNSGFYFCISEKEDFEHNFSDLDSFLTRMETVARDTLRLLSVQSEIDFGFTVGGKIHFTRTIRFPATILARVASLGITLAVTGYPSSDD